MYKVILLFLAILISNEGEKKSIFTSPLDIPLTLSANFGELRPGHFHSGLDFKTNGVKGKKVFSVEDGYIYRISVSPGGFGNAIYIRHNNGYSSVYGHLDRFNDEIEDFVTGYQYEKESFSVNIFPEREKFEIIRGELIGYSGNSGSSFGPHLHFELRKSNNENPIDPLPYFEIIDNIKPTVKRVTVYSLSKNKKRSFNLTGSKGIYRLRSDKVIPVQGEFGIGITAWDFMNDSWNKCGIRTIEVFVDSLMTYRHSLDEFSFGETRYINSHIDYQEYMSSRTYIQKAFIEPNNRLSIYDSVLNSGIVSFNDSLLHGIRVNVIDYSGNHSTLEFSVQNSETYDSHSSLESNHLRPMPFNQVNDFIRHDIRITFPVNAFYDTLWFDYKKAPGGEDLMSDIHFVHNNSVPVHKFFELSIKPGNMDSINLSKAGIISIGKDENSFIGGEFRDGFFSASIRDLGIYSIGVDSIAPEIISLNFKSGNNLKGRSEIKISIKDDFSGISSFTGTIDGKWALFEWDPKNDLLRYIFEKGRLEKDNTHEMIITVTDGRNNTTELTRSFYW